VISEYIEEFLAAMGEPDMAIEVANMRNRLEAYASGVDKDCMNVLREQLAAAQKNEARYLWLRGIETERSAYIVANMNEGLYGCGLDEAIDTAMGKEEK
jgi:hypothetical protein